jgi:predicted metal-dependent hydrolase
MGFFTSRPGKSEHNKRARSQLILDGKTLEVTLRGNARAKRIILRLDKSGRGLVLTVPPHTSHAKALEFAASQGVWISQQLAKQTQPTEFSAGQIIPVRGVEHRIIASGEKRTPVWCDVDNDGVHVLKVSGDESHHGRRVQDWLKKQARQDLNLAAFSYAEKMNGKISRISIRDTASRWGSCSSQGALSFSWRLILAPSYVLDYVAAHEAAHLLEMNHSDAFWLLVETHCKHTAAARKWLKTHGARLHKYGTLKK